MSVAKSTSCGAAAPSSASPAWGGGDMDGESAHDRGITREEKPPRRGGLYGREVRERVDALGWRGQPFPTVFANIVWQYLSARLDEKVPLRLIEGEGVHDASRDRECCERALEGMLNEAQRVGLLDLLQCPQHVRDSDEVLSILQRVFGR